MDWTNLIIQLGISALVLFVVFKLAMKSLENMSKSDSERTMAIKEGFAADTAAHQAMAAAIKGMSDQFSTSLLQMASANARVEGKLDTVLDLTPVREMHKANIDDLSIDPLGPKVIVDRNQIDADEEDTPVDRPADSRPLQPVKQPRASSVGGLYGPKKPKTR